MSRKKKRAERRNEEREETSREKKQAERRNDE